ncbi:NUDIX hydrolase [Delftia sp. PS-11]|uniref:NUDIX hydrolase n=1 Tax=Delftia sp. PS-11 TaxID=2767222 RepID=UPI002457119C|nr:NUDIX domain-containing protein [Delftia sp. PS-11]KAJ8746630.1 NUDIX domain-containing protein [Delftia sp. PS-11]
MSPQLQSWLQRLRAEAMQPPAQPRRPLLVDGHGIGSLADALAAQLPASALHAQGLALQPGACSWHLAGDGDATARLNALAAVLRATGHSGPWRNEQLAVCNGQGQRIATVERGAVRPLGIATQAVHLIGLAPDGRIWVQQRADDKPTNPGMWDTLMGGMVAARDTVVQAVERETWEEAGLRVAQLAQLRHGGHVLFERPSDEAEGRGFMRERIDWFSAIVPDALRPDNQDGEVQGFALIDRAQLLQWLPEGRFTPEASMVLADWLGWLQ